MTAAALDVSAGAVVTERWCEQYVRDRLFGASASAKDTWIIGAELELIPFDRASMTRAPIASAAVRATLPVIRAVATRNRWSEHGGGVSVPYWLTADGGKISYEPGGQIEISSPTCATVTFLVEFLRRTVGSLRAACDAAGIQLEINGLDRHCALADVPLQLLDDRYVLMDRHFAVRGEAGPRMMRQTGSLQLSMQSGGERWRLLSAAAPYLLAIFANSSRYAGRDTGHASYRAHTWRTLDPVRTGLPNDAADPAGAYARFALDATPMFVGAGEFASFRDAIRAGAANESAWAVHLTTLFPEVRPRGYLELRSLDAIEVEWIGAPITLVGALAYAPGCAARALALLDEPDRVDRADLLARAGRDGMRDVSIAARAGALFELGLAGAQQLPREYVSASDLDVTRRYFERFTACGRAPCDEA